MIVSSYWKEGYVGFLIGCSFSFEESLMKAGIEIRHIAQGRNVPMYKTNIQTVPAGPFFGPMVCSMRPMTPENAKLPIVITHAPGHMFITDILNAELNDYLEAQKTKYIYFLLVIF